MSFVVDASMTLSWYFEDEKTDEGIAVLDRLIDDHAVVPVIWRLEVANGLQMAVRRQRIDIGFRDRALDQLASLNIVVDRAGEELAWTATLQHADRFRLTVYDAAYLEAAHRLGLPLASCDKALCAAARTLAVVLL